MSYSDPVQERAASCSVRAEEGTEPKPGQGSLPLHPSGPWPLCSGRAAVLGPATLITRPRTCQLCVGTRYRLTQEQGCQGWTHRVWKRPCSKHIAGYIIKRDPQKSPVPCHGDAPRLTPRCWGGGDT